MLDNTKMYSIILCYVTIIILFYYGLPLRVYAANIVYVADADETTYVVLHLDYVVGLRDHSVCLLYVKIRRGIRVGNAVP